MTSQRLAHLEFLNCFGVHKTSNVHCLKVKRARYVWAKVVVLLQLQYVQIIEESRGLTVSSYFGWTMMQMALKVNIYHGSNT